MPQLGTQKKKETEPKNKTKKIASDEVVSAYSEEGKARQQKSKRTTILAFAIVMVILVAILVVILLFNLGVLHF